MDTTQAQTAAVAGSENELTLEAVQSFINDNEDAKKWLNSEKDRFFTKSLESWKMKNLDALIEAEVSKRNPQKTAAEIKLDELQRKFEAMEKANKQAELKAYAIKEATELSLPVEFANFCLADSEEDTLTNLTTFKKAIDALVQEEVENRLKNKGGGRLAQTQTQAPTTGATFKQQPVTARDLFAQYLNNQN